MMPIVHHFIQNQIKPQKSQNFETQNLYNTIFLHNLNPQKPPWDMFQILKNWAIHDNEVDSQ
jgi:hypothetical protein